MILYSVGASTPEGKLLGEDDLTLDRARELAKGYARDGNSAEIFGWADGQNDPISREVFYAKDYEN